MNVFSQINDSLIVDAFKRWWWWCERDLPACDVRCLVVLHVRTRLLLLARSLTVHGCQTQGLCCPHLITCARLHCILLTVAFISGVTRVGDARGGNWGCHPSIFSWKTWRPFFAHSCHYHYRFLLLSLGYHPLMCVTPQRFYLSDLVYPLFFVNLPTKFFLQV